MALSTFYNDSQFRIIHNLAGNGDGKKSMGQTIHYQLRKAVKSFIKLTGILLVPWLYYFLPLLVLARFLRIPLPFLFSRLVISTLMPSGILLFCIASEPHLSIPSMKTTMSSLVPNSCDRANALRNSRKDL